LVTDKNKTMQVLIDIPDNEAAFAIKVLKSLSFVTKAQPMPVATGVWNDLQQAAAEVRQHKQGKLTLKTAQELLHEL